MIKLRTTTRPSAFLFYFYVFEHLDSLSFNGKNCAAFLLEMGLTKEAACGRFTAGTVCTLESDIKIEFSACNI